VEEKSSSASNREPTEFEVLAMRFCEVDMGWIKITMQDAVAVDVLKCLGQLIKDPPHFFLGNAFSLLPGSGNEILQRAASAVLHDDVDSDVLLVDGVVEVAQELHVVQPDERVDFVDDVFLLLGRERAEGDLLEHDLTHGGEGDGLEEVL
jgi:hypothetical protein